MEIINLKSSDEETSSTPNPANHAKSAQEHRITDLKSGVHDQNRINVFVDGEFYFSLDLAQVVDYHLKIGKDARMGHHAPTFYQGDTRSSLDAAR